jgi:hypothetical protein
MIQMLRLMMIQMLRLMMIQVLRLMMTQVRTRQNRHHLFSSSQVSEDRQTGAMRTCWITTGSLFARLQMQRKHL